FPLHPNAVSCMSRVPCDPEAQTSASLRRFTLMPKILNIEIVVPVAEDFVAPLELIADQVVDGFMEGFDRNDCGHYRYTVRDSDGDAASDKALLEKYRALHRGLCGLLSAGRLVEADIPDDFRWLSDSLTDLSGSDPDVDWNHQAVSE